jgi:hypothetical protein
VVWGNVRVLIPSGGQTAKYYTRRWRKANAIERYDYEKGKERRYYKKDNYRLSIGVSSADKPTGILLYNKKKIILKLSPDSHRDSYIRRNRDINAT